MAKLKPYSLKQVQSLIVEGWDRQEPLRRQRAQLNQLYRYGTIQASLAAQYGLTPGAITIADKLAPYVDAVNVAIGHINIIVAASATNDPRFVFTPVSGGQEAEDMALAAHGLAFHFWHKSGATEAMQMAHFDSVKTGIGFTKTLYNAVHEEVERHPDDTGAELAELLELEGIAAGAEGRDPLDIDELRGMIATTEVQLLEEQPVTEHVCPDDIIVPITATRLEDARWVAQRMVLPLDEIKANPAYSNTEHVVTGFHGDVTDYGRHDDLDREWGGVMNANDENDALLWAEIFEFYDRRTRHLVVCQRDGDKPLYDGPMPFSHRHTPFTEFRNYNDGENFWSFGDLELVAHLASLLNDAFSSQIDNLARSGNLYMANRNYVDEDTVARIQEAEPEEVIFADLPMGIAFDQVLAAFPRAPLPADVYEAQSTIQGAIQQVLGVNDFMAGGTGADRMSGTAAAITDGVASLRAQDKTVSVERGAEHIATIQFALLQEFLSAETAVRVAGPNGTVWVDVSPEDIYGEFRVTVETGSTKSVNPATRAQRGQQLMQMLPALTNVGLDPMPAMRSAFRDMGYDPDLLVKAAPPQPDPNAAPGMAPGMPPGPAGPQATGAPLPAGPAPLDPTAPLNASEASMEAGGPPVPAATEGDIAL